jgi:hypothetical protein
MSALQVQTQFDPNPGDTIQLFGGEYEFLANPKVSRFAYAVEGRKASVFKMKRRTGAEYALKVFRLAYRSNDSSRAFDALTRFSKLKGLTIAQRTLILPGSDEANHSPDLEYAVHMPWIASRTWANFLGDAAKGKGNPPETCGRLAKAFLEAMSGLEANGIAHTDISPGNVAFDAAKATVELLDLEDIYAPGLPAPARPTSGTDGYRHKSVDEGATTWCAEGDRYSSAILAAELICLSNPQLATLATDDGLFRGNVTQKDAQARFSQALPYLEQVAHEFAALVLRAWNSSNLMSCPTIQELFAAVGVCDFSKAKLVLPQQVPAPAVQAAPVATPAVQAAPVAAPATQRKFNPILAAMTAAALLFGVSNYRRAEGLAQKAEALGQDKVSLQSAQEDLTKKLRASDDLQAARLVTANKWPLLIGEISLSCDCTDGNSRPGKAFPDGKVKYLWFHLSGPNQFYGMKNYSTEIGVRYFKIDGANEILERNDRSLGNLSFSSNVFMSASASTWSANSGWGSDSGSYYNVGQYRIEFEHDGTEIGEAKFIVEPPSLVIPLWHNWPDLFKRP